MLDAAPKRPLLLIPINLCTMQWAWYRAMDTRQHRAFRFPPDRDFAKQGGELDRAASQSACWGDYTPGGSESWDSRMVAPPDRGVAQEPRA